MAYYFANGTVFLNDKLYFYRLRNDSITGSEFSMKRFDNIELMDWVIRVLKIIMIYAVNRTCKFAGKPVPNMF